MTTTTETCGLVLGDVFNIDFTGLWMGEAFVLFDNRLYTPAIDVANNGSNASSAVLQPGQLAIMKKRGSKCNYLAVIAMNQ